MRGYPEELLKAHDEWVADVGPLDSALIAMVDQTIAEFRSAGWSDLMVGVLVSHLVNTSAPDYATDDHVFLLALAVARRCV